MVTDERLRLATHNRYSLKSDLSGKSLFSFHPIQQTVHKNFFSLHKLLLICVPAQDNHGFVANAIIELQPKISENLTSGQ